MKTYRVVLLSLLLLALCAGGAFAREPAAAGAVPVRVARDGTRFVLLRDGRPYAIKGAGIDLGRIAALAAHGGNSLRTWSTGNGAKSGREVLDEAAHHGLTVAMGIEIGRERLGFDYDDEKAVAKQLEFARGEVLKYKDHPALLAWIIGNEANLNFKNPKVFDAINDISRMIHQLDPNHPTTTALAGFDAKLATLIDTRAPDLDFVSIQMYGGIVNLPRYLAEMNFRKPYMVTEWGATGHWEVGKTTWGSPIEHTSSEKAASYRKAYETVIASSDERLLGDYVFFWGQKQERTPTWYGLFLADGSTTEALDFMQFAWTGAWPANRAPRVESLRLDSKRATDNVVVAPGQRVAASVAATDPEGGKLSYSWQVVREIVVTQTGGDPEPMPPTVRVRMDGADGANPAFIAPRQSGAYRLFVYVHDGSGSAGHANIPFYVAPPEPLPAAATEPGT